jgi:hypothetical protein
MTDQRAGNLVLAVVFPDRQLSFVIESSWQAMMVLSGVSDIIEPNKNLGFELFWPVLNPVVFFSFF